MRRAHDGGAVAEAPKQLAPRLPRLHGIVIRHHAELWVARLQRRMDHIASDDGIGPRPADLHRVVVDGVTGCRKEGDEVVESVLALDDVGAIGSTESVTHGHWAASSLLRLVQNSSSRSAKR